MKSPHSGTSYIRCMDPVSHHLDFTGKRKQVKKIRIRLIISIVLLILVSSVIVIVLLS